MATGFVLIFLGLAILIRAVRGDLADRVLGASGEGGGEETPGFDVDPQTPGPKRKVRPLPFGPPLEIPDWRAGFDPADEFGDDAELPIAEPAE